MGSRPPRRPKPTKLALNAPLRTYVEESFAGGVVAPTGAPVPGPSVPWKGRRHGPRKDRRWAKAWSPEQIARRLPIDFPDDKTMRISHEAIYQALFVQGRGALRRELTACLRTGRVLRMPRARVCRRGKGFVSPEIMISERLLKLLIDSAGALGGRPHPRCWQLGNRHAGRAHDALHDAIAPSPVGGTWRSSAREERTCARGTRG